MDYLFDIFLYWVVGNVLFQEFNLPFRCSADVEEFYQQCDPGKGLRFSPSVLFFPVYE